MLPPMMIFFPLFTPAGGRGLPARIAYNLDKPFKRCHACGKQALTMCMGFGCNAAGIVGCRIIDSPRERMLAILTNNFVALQRQVPDADRHSHHVLCRRGGRRVLLRCVRPTADRRHPARHIRDFRRDTAAFRNPAEGHALLLYAGTAAIPETAGGESDRALRSGPDPCSFWAEPPPWPRLPGW